MNQIKDFFEYIFNAIKIWVIVQPWQQGIRVRNGKKVKLLDNGIYFKIPYFDSVYVQENKLRIGDVPMQTVTTKDLKSITIASSVGYTITDIEKLYNSLYHPETTIRNIAMSIVASMIFTKEITEVKPDEIEKDVLIELQKLDYGLTFDYFRITNFAVARTYRLIQDQNWGGENLKLDEKR
jgi:regulator of protease activity HflC (stomatin/prohibitin superfamily)